MPLSEILRSSVRPQESCLSKYRKMNRRSIGARLQGYATFSFMSISVSICQLCGMWFKTNWVRWKQSVEDFWREPPNRLTKRFNSMADSKISRQLSMFDNGQKFQIQIVIIVHRMKSAREPRNCSRATFFRRPSCVLRASRAASTSSAVRALRRRQVRSTQVPMPSSPN